jgi:hypothetical protein
VHVKRGAEDGDGATAVVAIVRLEGVLVTQSKLPTGLPVVWFARLNEMCAGVVPRTLPDLLSGRLAVAVNAGRAVIPAGTGRL